MNFESFISGAAGAGLLAIILRIIEHYLNRGKEKAETSKIKSEAGENITEAAQVAVGILERALNYKASENQILLDRMTAMEERQAESSVLRSERDAQIAELQKRITEAQEQNDALHAKLAGLQAQIEKDTKRIVEIEEKYNRMKRVNEKLVQALVDAKVPLPDMNGDLTDSVKGLKWKK